MLGSFGNVYLVIFDYTRGNQSRLSPRLVQAARSLQILPSGRVSGPHSTCYYRLRSDKGRLAVTEQLNHSFFAALSLPVAAELK